ncbi:hypothetical protein RchiOBHm_Chr6g0266581 [Rosa chinensis]|uniref:Uncharacterized protein n=1 Tax=Rosa chinensis TaxID=74649 RepID=A0A2P6PPP3_ROSCH|nr:hypothetical protein RchiOBHm_Chr6g0266581 [Rosa chinensis]
MLCLHQSWFDYQNVSFIIRLCLKQGLFSLLQLPMALLHMSTNDLRKVLNRYACKSGKKGYEAFTIN